MKIGNQAPPKHVAGGIVADDVQLSPAEADLAARAADAMIPKGSWLARNPVLLAVLVLLVPDVIVFLESVLTGESWPAAGAVLIAAVKVTIGRVVWSLVTPVADPKLAPDLPLSVELDPLELPEVEPPDESAAPFPV